MPNRDTFPAIFAELKGHFQVLAPEMQIEQETPESFYLRAPATAQYPKGVWYGGVEIKKNYVSYHLMPVYMNPALLDGISAPLRKRMQGKACFNFTTADTTLFAELAQLNRVGAAHIMKEAGS